MDYYAGLQGTGPGAQSVRRPPGQRVCYSVVKSKTQNSFKISRNNYKLTHDYHQGMKNHYRVRICLFNFSTDLIYEG